MIFGPDVASLILTILLVAGPAVAFCFKVYHTINVNKKDGKDVGYWYIILLVAAILTFLVSCLTWLIQKERRKDL